MVQTPGPQHFGKLKFIQYLDMVIISQGGNGKGFPVKPHFPCILVIWKLWEWPKAFSFKKAQH
jgi:hypothetical protein